MKCVFYVWSAGASIICAHEAHFMWKGFSFCQQHIEEVIADFEGTLWVCQRMY